MECTPVKYTIEFCLGCNTESEFINGIHCIKCSCDNPFGNWDDDNITQEEWDKYFEKHLITLT